MKLCGFEVQPGHGGAERSATKSGNPLCDIPKAGNPLSVNANAELTQSHVELTRRVGHARHQTGSVEL